MRDSEIGTARGAEHLPAVFSDVAGDMLTAGKAGKFYLIAHGPGFMPSMMNGPDWANYLFRLFVGTASARVVV
jgi:hypothetical protein